MNTNTNPLVNQTNELIPVKSTVMLEPQSYKVAGITIPGDIKLFNQMWLNKDFDKITPEDFDPDCIPTMFRGHNFAKSWDTIFFSERRKLTYMTAKEMWDNSIHASILRTEINQTLHCHDPLEGSSFSYDSGEKMIEDYLSRPPETLMFTENKPIVYKNPRLLPIYRDLIARFQLLIKKTNDERISIYLDELRRVSEKIRFIQTLSYYGLQSTILRFKKFKNNYLEKDREIKQIKIESMLEDGFLKISFKKALYDFYSLCVSPEKETEDNMKNVRFMGAMVLQYEDIQSLTSCYLLPMRSSIRQDKMPTVCCQVIISYLRPTCVTERYVVEQLV
jgi:hypothetical protein